MFNLHHIHDHFIFNLHHIQNHFIFNLAYIIFMTVMCPRPDTRDQDRDQGVRDRD